MTNRLINEPDFNEVFAENAAPEDAPQFIGYPIGWGVSRVNNGKPLITQSNYIANFQDKKSLWIRQNGAALPWNPSVDYANGVFALKDGELKKFNKVENTWVIATGAKTDAELMTENGETQREINNSKQDKLTAGDNITIVGNVISSADNSVDGATLEENTFHGDQEIIGNIAVSGSYEGDLTPNIKEALNATGEAPMFACRAWVNFSGDSSPPQIQGEGNVLSVTRFATGHYDVTFKKPLRTKNYAALVTIDLLGTLIEYRITTSGSSAGSIRIQVLNRSGGVDARFVSLGVFC